MAAKLPRRGLIAGIGGAAALAALNVRMSPASASPSAESYDQLRLAWRDFLTGGDVDPADPRVAAALEVLDRDARRWQGLVDRNAGRTQVFTDTSFAGSAGVTTTYTRLVTMALAWSTAGSTLHQNASVLADVLAGLATVHERVYKQGQVEYGNWWDWEIGSTRALGDACTLVYDHLPAAELASYLAAIDHFVPDPFWMFPPERGRILSTGANRVDLCRAIAVRGILGQADDRIARSRDGLSDVFAYVTTGDGFYRDGSFVQHTWVAYTGTYGVVLLDGMSKLIALLAGSPWEVNDPNRSVLFDAVERTFQPVIYDNQMLDFVRGRAISRSNARDHNDAHGALEHLLKLADGVAVEDQERAQRWRAMVKGWMRRDTHDDIFAGARVPRVATYARVLADESVPAAPEPVTFTVFPGMDRVVHRRPGWAYALSMASKRIAYYESGNGENEKGFHTGEGMAYLYNADNGQYADNFWPTVDLYRLPGTTIDKKPLPNKAGGEWGEARPANATWVGGVAMGEFGSAGMDVEGITSPMRAKKSWFCLDEYVVALGAGITGASGYPVETIVENRNLHDSGENAFIIDGDAQPLDLGWSETRSVRWAHLAGVGGYVFPGGAELSVKREARTGRWRDIHQTGPTTPITRRYLTAWFDHKVDPAGEAYAYVLLPGATPARTSALAESESAEIRVLANTPSVQAISVPRLGVVAANFWTAGTVGELTVSAPCAVFVREARGELAVGVSDPGRGSAQVEAGVRRGGYRSWHGDPTVHVQAVRPWVSLLVDTSDGLGGTHSVRFSR
jgi:hyaluronate lyase